MRATYRERIIDIDIETAEVWGRLNAVRPLPVTDSLLAATASARGWILATRNTSDLAHTEVRLLNPFD